MAAVVKAGALWAAMRALHEGGAATLERLALISGRTLETVKRRAAKEAWDGEAVSLAPAERAARLQALSDRLLAEMEKEGRRKGARAGAKARIDEILASVRTLEKFGDLSRQIAGGSEQEEEKTDAKIAAILARLHGQMLDIARHHARRMAEAELERRRGLDDPA